MRGHTIVVDLSYGDSGKGTVVDWLCATRSATPTAVIRFNGGGQAAHNVVTSSGRHHTFSQFGSGSFSPHVSTFLSRYMLVDPLRLETEARALTALGLTDILDRLHVDEQALVVTPYHQIANRARELARGPLRHGSCGAGIGETQSRALLFPDQAVHVHDLLCPSILAAKLRTLSDWVHDEFSGSTTLDTAPSPRDVATAYRWFASSVHITDLTWLRTQATLGDLIFEGAQGVLLDEWRGFHPHTTWSTTTFDNAETLLSDIGLAHTAYRLGVLRSYTTRHGAGPMPSEDPLLTTLLPDTHNTLGDWQGQFRVGHFDAVAHRYAIEVCGGIDGLALTCLDRSAALSSLGVVDSYVINHQPTSRLVPTPHPDLNYQEQLTHSISSTPIHVTPHGRTAPEQVDCIQELTRSEVVVRSFGPRTSQKLASGSWAQDHPARRLNSSIACQPTPETCPTS